MRCLAIDNEEYGGTELGRTSETASTRPTQFGGHATMRRSAEKPMPLSMRPICDTSRKTFELPQANCARLYVAVGGKHIEGLPQTIQLARCAYR